MIDTHCHLQTDAFDQDRDEVLERARIAGVENFIVPAIDRASLEPTIALTNGNDNIFCALGIHPHNATEWNPEVKSWIEDQARNAKKVVAIGEIGLDYHYDFSPRDIQREAFSAQIELAKSLLLPIVIHTRESDGDVLKIVGEHFSTGSQARATGQFHCFSGSLETLERVLELGFYVSFTGNITFKNSTLSAVVLRAPLERILLETDSPYMTPVPFRGRRNAPEYLPLVAKKIAEIKGIESELVMKQTKENAIRLFSLNLLAVFTALVLTFCSTNSFAQRADPVGNKPPDSVMNDDRRKAEEQIRLQREEMQREAEKRREDSLAEVRKIEQESLLQAQQQARLDSVKAAQKIADEEAERLRLQTPIAWKAVGIGGGLGVGNLPLAQNKNTLTPTSVLATSIQLGTQLTHVIDVEASYMNMHVGDDLTFDKLYNNGPDAPTGPRPNPVQVGSRLPIREDLYLNGLSFDVRFVITPRTAFKFYAGIGYMHISIENKQQYHLATTNTETGDPDQEVHTQDNTFGRGAIRLLFGVREDLELGNGFILTPFAQIMAAGAFQGQEQLVSFAFQADRDQIVMTHLNIGVNLYFGWFGVERYH